eukprot:TRINITY_DN254_c0_g1_i1.p1 TRINITY_DN254_c0_g1~~TRINITY_DN254_c0_g1_i1.p1  ORF type:complete len:272 (-),score=53.10 TRINITY_DN254_c0_g1_i1:50-808(-)
MTKILLIDFGIQWTGFTAAAILQTEKFYDFLGTGSYMALGYYSYSKSAGFLRQKIVTGMMCTWSFRLWTFLTRRIIRDQEDKRFANIRGKPIRFFIAWTVQAIWVFLTASPVFIVNSNNDNNVPLNWSDYIGWVLWAAGLAIEAIADQQKFDFRSDKNNKDKFINTGLWKYSRHPNYFGEILLWTGTYLSSRSVFQGWQNLGIISPLFITFLLTRVSGIPLVEKANDKKWNGNPKYEEYKRRTSILIPMPPK